MDMRGKSPGARAHQWKKGQSGNPAGMTKGTKNRPLSDRAQLFIELPYPRKLKQILENVLGQKLPKDFTWGDAVILRLCLSGSVKGDTTASRELREAIEGKARQRIELTGIVTELGEDQEDGAPAQSSSEPIVLRIVYDKDKSHAAEEGGAA